MEDFSDLTPPEDWNLKELQDNQFQQLVNLFRVPLVVLDPGKWIELAVDEYIEGVKSRYDKS